MQIFQGKGDKGSGAGVLIEEDCGVENYMAQDCLVQDCVVKNCVVLDCNQLITRQPADMLHQNRCTTEPPATNTQTTLETGNLVSNIAWQVAVFEKGVKW